VLTTPEVAGRYPQVSEGGVAEAEHVGARSRQTKSWDYSGAPASAASSSAACLAHPCGQRSPQPAAPPTPLPPAETRDPSKLEPVPLLRARVLLRADSRDSSRGPSFEFTARSSSAPNSTNVLISYAGSQPESVRRSRSPRSRSTDPRRDGYVGESWPARLVGERAPTLARSGTRCRR
jgi:hypothetical protein